MHCIYIRFYAELNDLIPVRLRGCAFSHCLNEPAAVKDVIESLGVPHTEVDLVIIDGLSAPFSARLQGGENVAVYPFFRSLDLGDASEVRPRPLAEYRFVLDSHLGKLAAYLRMLGFDTLYCNVYHDAELADLSSCEHRVLLTSDRGLLKRKQVVYGYLVRSKDPVAQLQEVVGRFRLWSWVAPFSRCMRCNGRLKSVAKETIRQRLPARVAEFCDDFAQCADCGQIYWPGTHYQRMQELISDITNMDVS